MQMTWVIAIVVVALILLGIAVFMSRRRQRPTFELRQLSSEQISGYQGRMSELEAMFVAQPREAVAAARLMVDDMLIRIGYPVRLSDEERVRDLQSTDSSLGERYRLGSGLKGDATTEQLRRALQAYLEMARSLTSSAAPTAEAQAAGKPRLAG